MRRERALVILAIGAMSVLPAPPARAHGVRTAYVEINESEGDVFVVTIRTTFPDPRIAPRFPDHCIPIGDAVRASDHRRAWAVRCPGGLSGRTFSVDGLGPIHTEAVVRLARESGPAPSHVVTPERPQWLIPSGDSWRRVGAEYVELGIKHILGGPDHLLFLLALALLLPRVRTVLLAETAFTLSHSLTLSLTALGRLHASSAAAEAAIALSLVIVALQMAAPRPPDASTLQRQGPLYALVFGLVHGLGFAGGLSEIGLPDGAVAFALCGFGLGVEIGQVAFLALVLCAVVLLDRTRPSLFAPTRLAAGYLVGGTGCFWLLQRLWGMAID